MTMNQIQYNPNDYEVLKTQEMDEELVFKLVRFSTGYYGVLSYNPLLDAENVLLISHDKDDAESNNDEELALFKGLACQSFLIFAKDAKKYLEKAPLELVIRLGENADEEYREVITREQGETLYEKAGICYEIMNMKMEDSFHYKYGDYVLTGLICLNVLLFILVAVNSLKSLGVI